MKNIRLSFIFAFFVAGFAITAVAEGRVTFYGTARRITPHGANGENRIGGPFASYVGGRHGDDHFRFVYHNNRGFKHGNKDHSRAHRRSHKDGYRDGYKKGYKYGYRDGHGAYRHGNKHGNRERSHLYRRHHRGRSGMIYGYGFGFRYRH